MICSFKVHGTTNAKEPLGLGWVPSLPEGADSLWRQFGDLGGRGDPLVAVRSKGQRWEMFLGGIDSGTRDSFFWFWGRPVLVSIYLNGTSNEEDCATALLRQYVEEVLMRRRTNALKRALGGLVRSILPIRDKDETSQISVAFVLLNRLLGSTCRNIVDRRQAPKVLPHVQITPWNGILTEANAVRFVDTCRLLASGSANGSAVALACLHPADTAMAAGRVLQARLPAALLLVPQCRIKSCMDCPEHEFWPVYDPEGSFGHETRISCRAANGRNIVDCVSSGCLGERVAVPAWCPRRNIPSRAKS